mgnify:FL=1
MIMQIKNLTPGEFASTFQAAHIFNTVAFAQLNSDKVERVHYLSFDDPKTCFGIVLGESNGVLRSPFSAPFGGFLEKGTHGLERMEKAVDVLADYARERSLKLLITLPPLVYDETKMSKWVSVMIRKMQLRHIDLNYHLEISHVSHYNSVINSSARNHLNQALRQNYCLHKLNSDNRDDVARVYNVISCNHKERGFPLRMTFEQVWQTISNVVSADFFVLEHEGCDVAAAQVFHVAAGIAQVVYWGDIRQYAKLRPMNYLAYSLFGYYADNGLRILDIGPSTENGIPNYGLCEFKESIGCSVTMKYSFEL